MKNATFVTRSQNCIKLGKDADTGNSTTSDTRPQFETLATTMQLRSKITYKLMQFFVTLHKTYRRDM